MSTEEENVNLRKELRASQELLFLVLDKIGEPVVLSVDESRDRMSTERAIDLALNEEDGTWTLQVIDLG